jgi:hypothetical protein
VNSALPAAYQPFANGPSIPGHPDIIDLVMTACNDAIVPGPPSCAASTDCAGTVTMSCVGDNGLCGVQRELPAGGERPLDRIDDIGQHGGGLHGKSGRDDCIQVVATEETSCPPPSGPPPLCNLGETWCTRFTPRNASPSRAACISPSCRYGMVRLCDAIMSSTARS